MIDIIINGLIDGREIIDLGNKIVSEDEESLELIIAEYRKTRLSIIEFEHKHNLIKNPHYQLDSEMYMALRSLLKHKDDLLDDLSDKKIRKIQAIMARYLFKLVEEYDKNKNFIGKQYSN